MADTHSVRHTEHWDKVTISSLCQVSRTGPQRKPAVEGNHLNRMQLSFLFLTFIIMHCSAENFVNICDDPSGNHCCAEGTERSSMHGGPDRLQPNKYWIMQVCIPI